MATTALIIDQESFEQFKDLIIKRFDNLEDKLSDNSVTSKEWLTSQDVQSIYQISHSTLQKLRNQGDLPSHRHGGKILYLRTELNAYFSSK